MMQGHDARHGDLLSRILVGELARDGAEAQDLMRQCPACRRHLAELEDLGSLLDRAGSAERKFVREAASAPVPPAVLQRFQELASNRVQGRLGTRPSAPARWRTTLIAAAALSAASLLAVWGLRGDHGTSGDDPEVLLGEPDTDLVGSSPTGSKAELGAFAWRSRPLAGDETFTLVITDLERAELDPLVVDNIRAADWRPDQAGIADARRVSEFFALPPLRIEWHVEIRKSNRVMGRSAPLRASSD